MIEIEKKFLLTNDALGRLLDGAEDKGEVVLVNTYYDTSRYELGKKDWWLRKRNNGYELKISLDPNMIRAQDQYREVEDEAEIRTMLGLESEGEMEETLAKHDIVPFGSWTTTRHAYTKDGFTIDVDHVDYGSFTHDVVEIELLVENQSDAESASRRILDFASAHGLSLDPVPGKVTTYLKRERPEHFEAIRKARMKKE